MSISKTTEIYSFESKKKIKERIEKIYEKDNINIIKQLIFKNNPGLQYSHNSSGILLFFHNLTDDTYSKIDLFLRKINNEKVKELSSTYTEEETISDFSDLYANNIRLSSLEKNIIKKKDYYDKLKEENNTDKDIIFNNDDNLELIKKPTPIKVKKK